jgi:hypothetical protein
MIICWELQSAVLSDAFSPAHKTQRQIDPTFHSNPLQLATQAASTKLWRHQDCHDDCCCEIFSTPSERRKKSIASVDAVAFHIPIRRYREIVRPTR